MATARGIWNMRRPLFTCIFACLEKSHAPVRSINGTVNGLWVVPSVFTMCTDIRLDRMANFCSPMWTANLPSQLRSVPWVPLLLSWLHSSSDVTATLLIVAACGWRCRRYDVGGGGQYIGWQWRNLVPYLRQLVFGAILWVKPLEIIFTVISLKYALLAS